MCVVLNIVRAFGEWFNTVEFVYLPAVLQLKKQGVYHIVYMLK